MMKELFWRYISRSILVLLYLLFLGTAGQAAEMSVQLPSAPHENGFTDFSTLRSEILAPEEGKSPKTVRVLPEQPVPYADILKKYRVASSTSGRRLSLLAPEDGTELLFTGRYNRYERQVFLPSFMNHIAADVQISFLNSIDVLPEESSISLFVENSQTDQERFLASVPLKAFSASAKVRFHIPDAFVSGENKIILKVEQVHRLSCGDQETYDLWTKIDGTKSFIEISTQAFQKKPVLSDLSAIFKMDALGGSSLSILNVGSLSETFLTVGSHVAQGYSLRRQAVGFDIKVITPTLLPSDQQSSARDFPRLDMTHLPDGVFALIGRKDELEHILSSEMSHQISDGFIGLFTGDPRKDQKIIVISGLDDRQVEQAARTFAHPNLILPEKKILRLSEARYEKKQRLFSAESLQAGHAYAFGQDLKVDTLSWYHPSDEKQISFRLPADYFVSDDRLLHLSLKMRLAEGIGSDAALSLYVNGKEGGIISLQASEEGQKQDATIDIPMGFLKAGQNKLMLKAYVPQEKDTCSQATVALPRLQILPESTIEFDAFAQLGALPNLQLWTETAYPYETISDQTEKPFDLYVPTSSVDAFTAAFLLMGRLAEQAGRDLPVIGVTTFPTLSSRNMIVVGTFSDLPDRLFEQLPVKIASFPEAFKTKDDPLHEEGQGQAQDNPTSFVGMVQNYEAILTQYQSPKEGQASWTLITVQQSDALLPAVKKLVQTSLWQAPRSGFFAWSATGESYFNRQVDPYYYQWSDLRNLAELRLVVGVFASEHYSLWVGGVLLLIFLFAVLTFKVVRQVGQGRSISEEEA